MRTNNIGVLGSSQTNTWASQRREERKTNFAKTGEMAIFSVGNEDSTNYSRGINISNGNSLSTISSLRAKDPFGGSNMPKNMQGTSNKFASNNGDRPPSHEEVREAQSSLQLLKSKMKSRTGEGDAGTDTRDKYLSRDSDTMQGIANSRSRNVFKPNTLSKERLKTKEIDDMTKNINDELDIIQSNLNKKNHLLKNSGSRSNDNGDENYKGTNSGRLPVGGNTKPNMGGPSNKFGGIPRVENKSNAFSNDNQEFGSDNFPTRIPKNTLNHEISPSNGVAPKKGLFRGGLSSNDHKGLNNQGISIPSYQDSNFNDLQPSSTTNKGITVNDGLKKNQFGEYNQLSDGGFNKPKGPTGNTMNKFQDKDEGPTDTRTSKVFSKPNLKRIPNKQKEDPANEDYNPPKNSKSIATKNTTNKKASISNYGSENAYNVQPTSNPLEEIPISKLKQGGSQIPDEDMDADLIVCPEGCGRKFKEEALEKHVKVCKKVFQSQRKKYDSAAARKTDELLQLETKPKKSQTQSKQPQKKPQSNSAEPKWKAQSEALRAGLKAARGETLSHEEQAALKTQAQDDLILCPNCNRKFNEKAAEKHLPFCASKSKVDSMKSGGKNTAGGRGPAKKY